MKESIPDDLKTADVAVLLGGPGAERAVSLQSGATIAGALRGVGLTIREVDVSGDPTQIRDLDCDVAVLALHGEFGEDGTVQRLLDEARIPYTGSDAHASALCMDKHATKEILVENGLPTPPWAMIGEASIVKAACYQAGIGLPLVLKPRDGGSSIGTTVVRNVEELRPAAEAALAEGPLAMIEQFVPGRELTIGMVGGEILPAVELVAEGTFYDYEAKYESDATQYRCPAPLDEETERQLQGLASLVFGELGVRDMARVDIMLSEIGPFILEVNTLPGFTSHSLLPMAARAAGIDLETLCLRILKYAWARRSESGRSGQC